MRRNIQLFILFMCVALNAMSQRVTIQAVNQPAANVFRTLIEQTGMNFVYSSEILNDVNVTLTAVNKPLKSVLSEMFAGTDIKYEIKGNNIVLKRKKKPVKPDNGKRNMRSKTVQDYHPKVKVLDEVTVESRLESPVVETTEIGARKITPDEVLNTPALFGEADVIKALQTQPGISEGSEGMAGMHVHGGNADENLYMLDNVPLYQVNHFAGLFSAFNPDIIRYIDFFKSSMPAKYEGRLSSFMDVRIRNGSTDGHHGSARVGLTSGAFNISGPVSHNTTYLIGIRRSWYDLLTVPVLAIANSNTGEKTRFQYYFMDLNAKLTHRFSDKASGFVSMYFGDDLLKSGMKDDGFDGDFAGSVEDDKYDFHWGNLVAQTGLNYRLSPTLSAEFTAAYTRYFSSMKHHDTYKLNTGSSVVTTEDFMKTKNNINDWILRSDFDWRPNDQSRVRFGANYVLHSFLPARNTKIWKVENITTESRDSTLVYHANEVNAYIEDDWRITDKFRINAGIHASLFHIERKLKHGISPRISCSFNPADNIALKAAYSRTTQYVHQLTQTYLSLPTDQWIPVTGDFKPQTADKVSLGGYWQTPDKNFSVSVEGYYKWMYHLVDYRDEYYLMPPLEMWNAALTQGDGTAKGVDFKIEKIYGRFTGHISYSLAWADRTFPDKNGGHTFPARFDNRHSINVLVNWNINDKVTLNASWTGHTGNRFTLLSQMWETPPFVDAEFYFGDEAPLRASINNYRLPFYHRLDLSCSVKNRRGYWTFGLYNAYNHMNVIGIKRDYKYTAVMTEYGYSFKTEPVFQKITLLPIFPSISYTWLF